tara:strand:- start:1794 stop:1985 length:192 start_codon:yes stop_codon:yes gene_type:complete
MENKKPIDKSYTTYEYLYNNNNRFRDIMVNVEQAQSVGNTEMVSALASNILLEFNIDIMEDLR